MPSAKKQTIARSHSDSVNIVCAVCWKKPTSTRKVTEKISEQIKKLVCQEYDLKNYYHPKVVCDACRVILSVLSKDPDNNKKRLPPIPDYNSLQPPPPMTRSGTHFKCYCKICDVARLQKDEYKKHYVRHSYPVGRPKNGSPIQKARTLAICSRCFSVKGKGLDHNCTKVSKQMNIVTITKSSSEKTKGKIKSDILKNVCTESGVSLKGGELSLTTGGKKLSVQVGKSSLSFPKPKFTHESLKRLQAANNFSERAVKNIAAAFRVVAGRHSVEKNFSSSLVDRNKLLEELFEIKALCMKQKPRVGEKNNSLDDREITVDDKGYIDIQKEGVFYTDCDELLQLMLSNTYS